MKTFHAPKGPFIERPYFEVEEIEQICCDELRTTGLYPSDPAPIRIERFIEKRFGITPNYEKLPVGVLGLTRFGLNGVEEIIVSTDLTSESSRASERRINTTLAHEAGHGLLHAYLFALETRSNSLFNEKEGLGPAKILCREDAVHGTTTSTRATYNGRWWEYQANRAIGGLLLPKLLVQECLGPLLKKSGMLGARILDSSQRGRAVQLLSGIFDVNPIVAVIRLAEIYPEDTSGQLTL